MKSASRARIALAALLLSPTAVAADFRVGERIVVAVGETVSDDLYVTAGKIEIAGRIDGDLIAAGGEVHVTGEVTGDVFLVCGEGDIAGTVGDDAHITAGELRISGRIGDDLLAAGGSIVITSQAEIGGEVRVAAGELSIAGRTHAVRAVVGELSIAASAVVEGDVEYTSGQAADVAAGARTGALTQHEPPPARSRIARALSPGTLFAMMAAIVTALVLAALAPGSAGRVAEQWRGRFGASLLWGFVALVGIPAAAGIAMITIVGLPLGVGALLLYAVFLYLGWLSGMLGLGGWISAAGRRGGRLRIWAAIVIGALILLLLRLIPVAGPTAGCVVFVAGLGALARVLARRPSGVAAPAA